MPTSKNISSAFCVLVCSLLFSLNVSAQCGPTTPTFTCNLTGQPNGIYMSPAVSRADTCCGSSAPDRCIKFVVTLDPAAVGLIFTVCVGAVPPGALYYQVNCGPPQPVGTGICVVPPYPVIITFCKPGNNINQYCIQSIAPPTAVSLSQKCRALMWTFGFDEPSITWTSIAPGPIGAYNGYLSCTSACDSTWVTPQTGYPPYIDYKVCGTATNGCNRKFCDTIRVTFPPPLTITASTTTVSCYGGSNGTATPNPSGGVPGYTYSWNPSGGTSSPATGLSAGNYTATVTDAAGCTITTTVTIVQPLPVTATYTSAAATCSQANGSGTVNPSGGTPPYTYQWLNGQTTQTATGLAPGVYVVTIGDANGCPLTISIPISNVLPIVTVSSTTVTCYSGTNGTATSTASGGIPPYSYLWSPGGQTTSTATGLSAGTYTVATSSSGCVHYDLVTITQPTALTGTITAQNNVSCSGGSNGSAAITFSGGSPPYSYLWSNGQTTLTATGLVAGNYTVTVSDSHGCTLTNTISITQPPVLSAVPSSQSDLFCNGGNNGSATVTVSGGTPLYTYSWTGGQTTSSATGLSAGNYTCIVTDASGCTKTNTFVITQPPPIIANILGNVTAICEGKTVTLSGSASGGVPGYSYSWSPSGGTTSSVTVSPTTSTTYTLTVTDANGCTKTAQVPITVYPLPLAAFNAPNGCLNNAVVFSNSSTGSTLWSWNFGEPSSGPNNISTIQNPSHIYSSPGTYTVTLIAASASGCSDTVTHVVVINPLPTVSFTSITVCQGNTTTFNNTSFIPTGTITSWSWNFGDPGSGANNISLSPYPTHIFSTSGTFNVILTATSDSGCQNSVTLPVIVYPVPTASFVTTKGCSNAPVYFTDASTYATQWLWDFGNAGNASILQNPSYTYPSPGTYVVTLYVTSAAGCRDTVVNTITIDPSPVPNFSPDSVCVGAASSFIDLSVAPGSSVVQWLWNFGDGSPQDTVQNPFHSYSFPGTYTVSLTITASNGCKTNGAKTVLVFPQPTANYSYEPTTCITPGNSIEFTDLSFSNITNWYWYFGDTSSVFFTPNTSHTFNDTGIYVVSLIVQDIHGCLDTAYSSICVREWTFYIPNAFTPNGNGKNELFFGKGIGIAQYEMWIFDRWGNMIFHCDVEGLPQSAPCQWDGRVDGGWGSSGFNTIVQEDVYVWKVKLKTIMEDMYTYVGRVTVVK